MSNRFRGWPILMGTASVVMLSVCAFADSFDIPSGSLEAALSAYTAQTGVALMVSSHAVAGVRSKGVKGELAPEAALTKLLNGTGFVAEHHAEGTIAVVRQKQSSNEETYSSSLVLAQAAQPSRVAVETVTVTSSKLGGADVQSIPIAITALSQEQLTATQTAGGPDLIKQVPNMTFTKTNFSGYSIQLRGIGTQAISVTTDPAVAVALNDIPFIRNHFFEQEFYDLGQAEVLRGPQGTLYGRNATAGVVNLITAKPTDQFEAMASGESGSYHQRRFEGMINLPILDDRLDVRIAGEWTKRQGYSFNALTDQRIDGRDLWSGRVSIGFKPIENLQTTFVWEHFSEDDDRMRTAKQLCKTDPVPAQIGSVLLSSLPNTNAAYEASHYLSQGCRPSSLYSSDAFEVPNGITLPYYEPLVAKGLPAIVGQFGSFDPYASTTQSRNLRVIETQFDPIYKAKNDTVELSADYKVSPSLTLSSQMGYDQDFLWSTEDYNRFNTAAGAFLYSVPDPTVVPPGASGSNPNGLYLLTPDPNGLHICTNKDSGCSGGVLAGAPCISDESSCVPAGVFCDPQLGCSDRLVAEDLNDEHSWQLSQEFRLSSKFGGPLNFSVGGNYLHYETEENYYVFINTLSLVSYAWYQGTGGQSVQTLPWVPGISDNSNCLSGGFANSNPSAPSDVGTAERAVCIYIDPNPLTSLNNNGHNYFLSQNPYTLNSYAGFGEIYYDVFDDLKLTGGLRWTEDRKHFTDIPSELLVHGYGYPITGVVNQRWGELTGRAAVNWSPKLDFTDQTLIYGSYAHGYKAGGANPPGAVLLTFGQHGDVPNPIHPLTFKPEFIDAFEIGSKNTLADGALTLNGSAFYYDYRDYQISRIVDRTSINDNFDATVKGVELEATYEPVPGLRFNFAGGYEKTRLNAGSKSVDLIDRTDAANHPDWMVVKPFVTQASNCILPTYVVEALLINNPNQFPDEVSGAVNNACGEAYNLHYDPVTKQPFGQKSIPGYAGFDPVNPDAANNGAGPAPNNGQGFDKDLSGNELPNAPPFTISAGAQYTIPLSSDWAGTLRADYYWQDYSWARVFNDDPYDRLRGYTNVNLTLILTSQAGWQVMLYDKNVFNTTQITGTFLNSDDSGLTTNVFLTDPKLLGIRVTKNW